MSTDARGYVNARDNASSYSAVRDALRERDELRDTLEDAREALSRWEDAHELEYRVAFAQGEQATMNGLDAEWNELENDVEAASSALEAWSL